MSIRVIFGMSAVRSVGVALLLGLAVAFGAGPAFAQDPLSVAPQVYKKIMENNRMRVLEATFRPGDKAGVHSHPDHMIYMLTPGTLVLKPPERTAYEMTLKLGEAIYLPAQTRATENDTNQTVRVLIVELKTPAPAQARRATRGKRTGRGKRGRRR